MTQINHDVVRSAIRELIDSKAISGAALARETGTSTATVSQFLNGKYKGDNDTVAASLNTWLESHTAAKTSLPMAPDFVETPTSQKILATLTWAQLAGTIVLVYGNPGVGKTKAIRQYAATGNNVWHITASKSRSNELETLYELALKMGIADAPYRRGALSRLLRQRLPDNRAENPDLTKFIPVETHQLALNRAESAESKLNDIAIKESEALVDSAIEAGKVAPANREMYLATCRSEEGRKQFAEFVKAAPVIVSKTTTTKKESTEGHASLSDEDLAMCRHMGISEEEFLSVRKQEK